MSGQSDSNSLAQSLDNAGIHMQPGAFIAIIAGAAVLFIVAVAVAICAYQRSKRRSPTYDTEESDMSLASFAQPRPTLPSHRSSKSSMNARHAKESLLDREARQQEETYQQLLIDLRQPAFRASQPPLPDQTPRWPSFGDWEDQMRPKETAAKVSRSSDLKRGLSFRSQSSVSEYSTASAPRDAQGHTYTSFTAHLPTVPASPMTPTAPKWPSAPGPYAWPKRPRVSQMRDALAPETYAKARWKPADASLGPVERGPVA